jgi:uncharacterized protein (DUF427 family)
MTRANSAPGFAQHPHHHVDLAREPVHVRVVFNGKTVADSSEVVTVREPPYAPVYYIPRRDIRMDELERTTHASYCPFKGEASYWSVRVGDRVAENAAWSYESPYDEVVGIAGLVAFWNGRVDEIVAEPLECPTT